MRAYRAFVAKELMESLRSYKLVIMLAAFLLFGVMSPLFAMLLPEILNGVDFGDMTIVLPESTAMDSWAQFFKNVGQMGIMVVVIVFAGTMANELSSGTLINVLTKGMKRSTVLASKLTVAVLIWSMSYALCFAVAYAYTAYYWDTSEMQFALVAFLSPWLFGVLLIQVLILGGTLFKSFMGSLLTAGGVVATLFLVNIFPGVQKFNPITLIGDNTVLLTGAKEASDYLPAMAICGVLVLILAMITMMVFNKKQL